MTWWALQKQKIVFKLEMKKHNKGKLSECTGWSGAQDSWETKKALHGWHCWMSAGWRASKRNHSSGTSNDAVAHQIKC